MCPCDGLVSLLPSGGRLLTFQEFWIEIGQTILSLSVPGPAFNIFLRLCDFHLGPFVVNKYTAPGVSKETLHTMEF